MLGITRIGLSLKLRKAHQDMDKEQLASTWTLVLALGIILLICGILSLTSPRVLMLAIGLYMGIFIIASGANTLSSEF